ncbi:hypothetical protein Enr13x_15830 [Stieleria neptunia]|uniref:Glycosyl transferase family 2 n=1 Tax=Stieleria neptunia TaxID=2527979 RepID=A0A518HLP3_9BACT|nr:hypothetical protein [Stieleria neptunia]QDV41740.1 hypothetical protein Enr13x_15830 [Stieleria neptunia]
MPKFPRPARVSIVIPLQRDEKLFEETLLSVLENQTDDCQIIAVHNGTYADPFELNDEVSFVTARSSNLTDLVRDAFGVTSAPVVHVLGTGMRAQADWLDRALEPFDNARVGAVAPTLIDPAGRPVEGAHWADSGGRFCQSRSGLVPTGPLSGFFVNAFFARRHLLGNLLDAVAPAMSDPIAVSYAMGCLMKRAGWKLASADGCRVEAEDALESPDHSDMARGQCLGAIRHRVLPGEPAPGRGAMLREALLGSSSVGEMIGMMRYRNSLSAVRRAIDPDSVPAADDTAHVINLPAAETQLHRDAA